MEYKVNIEARIRCTGDEMLGEKERLAYLLEQHGYSVDFIYVTEGASRQRGGSDRFMERGREA